MIKTNYIYDAVVTKVVDGDTIDATVDLGFTVSVNVRFRLNDVNTMEMKDTDPIKRESAQLAKQFMIDKLLNKIIVISSYKTDKYGRWLADIYLNDEKINDTLIKEGLAVQYKK